MRKIALFTLLATFAFTLPASAARYHYTLNTGPAVSGETAAFPASICTGLITRYSVLCLIPASRSPRTGVASYPTACTSTSYFPGLTSGNRASPSNSGISVSTARPSLDVSRTRALPRNTVSSSSRKHTLSVAAPSDCAVSWGELPEDSCRANIASGGTSSSCAAAKNKNAFAWRLTPSLPALAFYFPDCFSRGPARYSSVAAVSVFAETAPFQPCTLSVSEPRSPPPVKFISSPVRKPVLAAPRPAGGLLPNPSCRAEIPAGGESCDCKG